MSAPPPLMRQGTDLGISIHDEEIPSGLSLSKQKTFVNAHGNGNGNGANECLSGQQLVSMSRVGMPVLSPNGQYAAFQVKALPNDDDLMADDSVWTTRIHIVDVETGIERRVTNAKGKSDHSPVWLDDETIAFLSSRSGSSQIWSISINGGEAEQMSEYPIGVSNLQYSSKGGVLLFSANVYQHNETEDAMKEASDKDKAAKEKKTNVTKYKKLMIRNWDHWLTPGKVEHVFVQAISRGIDAFKLVGKPVDVMKNLPYDCPVPVFGGSEDFQISPEGNEISYVVLANRDESKMAWTTNRHIFKVSVENTFPRSSLVPSGGDAGDVDDAHAIRIGEAVCITTANQGVDHNPVYSPDGKYILYLSMERNQYECDLDRVFLYDRSNGSTTRILSLWDISPMSVTFSKDSATLFLCAGHQAVFKVFSISLADAIGNQKLPQELISDGQNMGVVVTDARMLFGRSTMYSPFEVFSASFDGSNIKALTRFNESRLKKIKFGERESINFDGANGDKVQAWFIKPADFDPSKKYPLAVVIHGGPQGFIGDGWHFRWNAQTYPSHGYAYLAVNFHGSTSFGQAFTDSIRGDWGGKPFDDIMMGIDHVLQKYAWIDGDRMGALGASYGGYMINWINGHSDRFKCLMNHDGVFNMEAMFYNTEELYFTEWEMFGVPWESKEYNKWSPHKYVSDWKTPTLVIHGGKDYRVCETEGIATFTALQRLGIESEMLYFPDENHWVLNYHNSVVWHDEVIGWLDRFLKN